MTLASAHHEQASSAATAAVASGPLPSFLIIGGMKCGTTTLYELLLRHPSLYLCQPKEPQFFSRHHDKGEGYYRALFAPAGPGRVCGEASTCYTRYPHFGDVAARMHALLPQARLIYLMRHPVERAYSHYGHEMRAGVTMSFEQAIQTDAAILDASRYLQQIRQYLRFFDRRQLLLLTLDELERDPRGVVERTLEFLGLSARPDMGDLTHRANEGGRSTARKQIKNALSAVRRWPVVAPVADLVPRQTRRDVYAFLVERAVRSFIGRRLMREQRSRLHPMKPDTRQRLLELFRPDTLGVQELLGQDLAAWQK